MGINDFGVLMVSARVSVYQGITGFVTGEAVNSGCWSWQEVYLTCTVVDQCITVVNQCITVVSRTMLLVCSFSDDVSYEPYYMYYMNRIAISTCCVFWEYMINRMIKLTKSNEIISNIESHIIHSKKMLNYTHANLHKYIHTSKVPRHKYIILSGKKTNIVI